MQRRGWDERTCFSLWLTEQQWFITKRHSHSSQSSLLFLSMCVCVCANWCAGVCVLVNRVRFTYTACASHAVQKHRPSPPPPSRRPLHTANSLGRIYRLHTYTDVTERDSYCSATRDIGTIAVHVQRTGGWAVDDGRMRRWMLAMGTVVYIEVKSYIPQTGPFSRDSNFTYVWRSGGWRGRGRELIKNISRVLSLLSYTALTHVWYKYYVCV